MNENELPKIELPEFLRKQMASGVPQQEQDAMAANVQERLEAILGTTLQGFVVIPLREDGIAQIIAKVPADPGACVLMARAASSVIGRLLT